MPNNREITEYHYRDALIVVLNQCREYSQVLAEYAETNKWVFVVLPSSAGEGYPLTDEWHVHAGVIPGKKIHHQMDIFEDAKASLGEDLVNFHPNVATTKNRESAIKLARASAIHGSKKREEKALAKWRKVTGSMVILLGFIMGMLMVYIIL